MFVCTKETRQEVIERSLFGLGRRHLETMKQRLTSDTTLFCWDKSARQIMGPAWPNGRPSLHIELLAWGGRFPAQVRFNRCDSWNSVASGHTIREGELSAEVTEELCHKLLKSGTSKKRRKLDEQNSERYDLNITTARSGEVEAYLAKLGGPKDDDSRHGQVGVLPEVSSLGKQKRKDNASVLAARDLSDTDIGAFLSKAKEESQKSNVHAQRAAKVVEYIDLGVVTPDTDTKQVNTVEATMSSAPGSLGVRHNSYKQGAAVNGRTSAAPKVLDSTLVAIELLMGDEPLNVVSGPGEGAHYADTWTYVVLPDATSDASQSFNVRIVNRTEHALCCDVETGDGKRFFCSQDPIAPGSELVTECGRACHLVGAATFGDTTSNDTSTSFQEGAGGDDDDDDNGTFAEKTLYGALPWADAMSTTPPLSEGPVGRSVHLTASLSNAVDEACALGRADVGVVEVFATIANPKLDATNGAAAASRATSRKWILSFDTQFEVVRTFCVNPETRKLRHPQLATPLVDVDLSLEGLLRARDELERLAHTAEYKSWFSSLPTGYIEAKFYLGDAENGARSTPTKRPPLFARRLFLRTLSGVTAATNRATDISTLLASQRARIRVGQSTSSKEMAPC
ncbi:hypothetical protein CTAYLR_005755 [Chrysophaeum taylorii]|uniref:DCD domain-containing protein n=1 Tax=Chrysophaeum taylorii TaxID=2483200 RepID=A0AAD7UJK5_9STRA|nr:hypothetical protein CTAYLR_005755 [Chrysophaeum taylorii]